MKTEEEKEYLLQLNKAYLESSGQFDKQILFVASGALGVSFAFIKDLVKLSDATHKSYLIMAWVSFGIVILLSIISHYTSLKAINNKIRNLNYEVDSSSKKFNGYTKWINVLMIVFLGIGLLWLTLFVAINI